MKTLFLSGMTKTGKLMFDALEEGGHTIIRRESCNNVSILSNNGKFLIRFDNIDVSDINVVIIRSMKAFDKKLLRNLIMAMEANGTFVLDGSERVLRAVGDKSSSSLERSTFPGGVPTFIPSDYNERLPIEFPVIVKPVNGKYCRGVSVCYNREEYETATQEVDDEILVQKYIPFKYENRVLALNLGGNINFLYVASKRSVARRKTKRKMTFVPMRLRESLTSFLFRSEYVNSREGLIGYDVGSIKDGIGYKHYIIEANYSPRFDRYTKKTGVNIASEIVKQINRHVSQSYY